MTKIYRFVFILSFGFFGMMPAKANLKLVQNFKNHKMWVDTENNSVRVSRKLKKQKYLLKKQDLTQVAKIRFAALEIFGFSEFKILNTKFQERIGEKNFSSFHGHYKIPSGKKRYFEELILKQEVWSIFASKKQSLTKAKKWVFKCLTSDSSC